MIDQSILKEAAIREIAKRLSKKAGPNLVEKVIRALLLLEGLCQSGQPFTFKGGTAVMLLLSQPRRFSIDIDIITEDTDCLTRTFDKITKEKSFTSWEPQKRADKGGLSKSHFKFFYQPANGSGIDNEYVLLDIVIKKSEYNTTQKARFNSVFN